MRHDDTTTEPVKWNLAMTVKAIGGAHPPAGVPDNYGKAEWGKAVEADGPPLLWWIFGLQKTWGPKKRMETSAEISDLIAAEKPAWFLTGDNGPHETGPGRLQNMMTIPGEVNQRLGYAAFKQASPYHASSVDPPHGPVHITTLMKSGEDHEEDPRYKWRRVAWIDVLVDGAACVHRKSANAETVDRAVPLRIVFTHTVSSNGERKASAELKKKMILRSIEVGLACNHPNWICCGDYNASRTIVGEACADAQQKFGLVQVPTVMGDVKGSDFFISPRKIN